MFFKMSPLIRSDSYYIVVKKLDPIGQAFFQRLLDKKKTINQKKSNVYIKYLDIYSESQIYEYIARVFYNVVFSTYLGSNAAEKRV